MWCAKCHADVAAEVSPDNARARCANCGTELGLAAAVRAADKTREARELLERWSNNRTLDPYGPVLAPRPSFLEPLAAEASDLEQPASPSHREAQTAPRVGRSPTQGVRVDRAHSAPGMHPSRRSLEGERPAAGSGVRSLDEHLTALARAADGESGSAVVDRPHPGGTDWETVLPFGVQSAIVAGDAERTDWFQLAGHLLAYGGALVLTLGTALVLLGYFGGPPKMHYTPTGWLIATFGQLLLVSGVITLVSSGMERTTQEVSSRIEALGEKLLRVERAAGHAIPSGPTIPAERFAAGERPPARKVAERV